MHEPPVLMSLELERVPGEVRGTLRTSDGRARSFSGWLQLIATVERERSGHTPDASAPYGTEAVTRDQRIGRIG